VASRAQPPWSLVSASFYPFSKGQFGPPPQGSRVGVLREGGRSDLRLRPTRGGVACEPR